ncbi:MAG: competence/damage-inducible protein A [Deltaproteobacteria bacterium]|jgi:nicotinamide-nucleotide amidase|nr:competence/damage-inducible protein A [Deltaproteobacteria bacterium]
MRIEIITTGDEVMQGVIVDSNTAWIADRCAQFGHQVIRHESVGDDLSAIGDVLRNAAKRADAVMVTGGLGPTADDLTVEAASKAFQVKLIKDEDVLQGISHFFQSVGHSTSSSNEKQALIPEGSEILKNKVGTAPGIKVKLNGCWFFFMPGVPKELYQIFDDSVMPWLSDKSDQVARERVLRCFGEAEASIDEKLQGLDLGDTRLSFRVMFPEILLKLVARSKSSADADRALEIAVERVREKLGETVYGEGYASLSEITGRLLRDNNATLAVAESCTGGLIASMITDIPGASEYFLCGCVTYSNKSKMELLGVGEETLKVYGAVSAETAMAMAKGVRVSNGASMGVSVTGIAGPGGGTAEKPVGTVYMALSTPDGISSYKYSFNRDRVWFKQFAAAKVVDLVRRSLLGLLPEGGGRDEN